MHGMMLALARFLHLVKLFKRIEQKYLGLIAIDVYRINWSGTLVDISADTVARTISDSLNHHLALSDKMQNIL